MNQARIRNLDISTLRSFVTITEAGSMTRAASRLFMTQSAISMQIKRLETSLGMTVFDRSAQGMSTTTEGEQLLQYATQMLALNDEAMGRLTSPDFEGVIRLGAPSDIIYPHIPGILKEFSRDFPRVQIKLSSAQTFTLRDQFRQGMHDVVLTTEQYPREGGRVLNTQPLIWTGAENGVAWKKRPLPVGISRTCAFRRALTLALEEAGVNWIDSVASEDVVAGEAMTSADLCVSVELEYVKHSARYPIDHGGQLPQLPEFSTVLYCAQKPGDELSNTLVEYLLRAFSRDR